ncbi:MAG: hypothetical protein Q9166_003379 [cf. Caloplaca sp. 2 TL-2023]
MALRSVLSLLTIVFWVLHATAVSLDCSVPPLSLPWSNITVSANGVAVTRGIELGIGTPNQIFSLRPSTTLNNTRVVNVLDCGSETNTSCVGAKGGVFDSSKSSTFIVSLKNRWNGSATDSEAATGAYVYFNDVIDFQANGTVLGYPLVQNSDLVSGPETGLPLGQNSSFLAAVTKAGVAPSSVWGLDAGDRSLSPRDGRLIVGGYDTSRFTEQLTTFPIGNWTQQPCPLQVKVTEITYIFRDGTYEDLFDDNTDSMIACIEPFQQRFTFLPSMAKKFANMTAFNDSYPGLTFPVDGGPYPYDGRPDGELRLTLENGHTTTIPNDHLFTLKRGSDENGHYVVTNSSIVETGIAYNADDVDAEVQPILGGLYLTFNYLVVDYDNNRFQMARAVQGGQDGDTSITAVCTPNPTTADPDATSSQTNTSNENSSTKAAAIGGGTVGAVAGLAAIAVSSFFLIRKRRRIRAQQEQKGAEETLSPANLGPELFSDTQTPSELALVRD